MVQIGGYLDPNEHASFKAYATCLQISDSALANLLIVRELRCKRLNRLKSPFQQTIAAANRKRITAHISDPSFKFAVETHLTEVGLTPDQAMSILLRAELCERWLANSMRVNPMKSS
jgi:hypothetical protein